MCNFSCDKNVADCTGGFGSSSQSDDRRCVILLYVVFCITNENICHHKIQSLRSIVACRLVSEAQWYRGGLLVKRSSDRSCNRGNMIHNKVNPIRTCYPHPSITLQCRIMVQNTINFISFPHMKIHNVELQSLKCYFRILQHSTCQSN